MMLQQVIVVAAMLFIGAAGSSAVAGTIKLTASKAAVQTACHDAGGKQTPGKGSGGYGCKTSRGQITCDKKGNCTGTCEKCGTRTFAATQILKNRSIGSAALPPPVVLVPRGPYATRSYNSALTEAYRRYGNPQRPTDCPRYVINPDDECY